MGRTVVNASVTGQRGTRVYQFLVDTGSNFMGLPEDEIEALGLFKIPDGGVKVQTATGIAEFDSYSASVSIQGNSTPAIFLPSPIPLIGYEVLENLKMRVNPVSRTLEPVPPDEIYPPYMLLRRTQ